jgi:IclR family KDG regulon transcriptional repressor
MQKNKGIQTAGTNPESLKKDPNGYHIRAVERALQVLEAFTEESPERGLSEISQFVKLHKATTHRIVTTLLNSGYLERAGDGQRYRLGLRLASLGFNVIRHMDLRREALPLMHQLVAQLDEACDLSVFDRGEVFYIEVLQSTHAHTIAAAVGLRLPVHCTASGKLFLAHLPEAQLASILSRVLPASTRNTLTSPEAVRKNLDEIRSKGFSFDNEEMEFGIRALAAPIFNHHGELVAAISILAPANRMEIKNIPAMIKPLKKAAQSVSQRLGWKM